MSSIRPRRGSLYKRQYGNNWRWCAQVRYTDENGRWRNIKQSLTDADGKPILTDADTIDADGKRVQTTRNIRKARAALEAWRAELEGMPTGGNATVADYITADLDGRKGSIEASTMRKYRDYARTISQGLAGVRMRDLDVPRVRKFVRWMRDGAGRDGKGLALSTAKGVYALLRLECDRATENGDMAANPCTRGILRADGPRAKGSRAPNALDAEGARRANALLDSTDNGRLRVGARLALACGLRAGEVCALRWRDVDLQGDRLTVSTAIGRADGGTYEKEPKTEGSARVIPLPPTMAAELAGWQDRQRARWQIIAEGQTEGVTTFDETFVVGFADGRFITPHAISNAWTRLAKAGDEGGPLMGTQGRRVTFHDLRHTFATHAIAAGADVRSVAALMGHTDVTTTLNVYADALPEGMRAAMDAAAETLQAGTGWAR